MKLTVLAAALAVLVAWPAGAQVVSEGRTSQGIPVVVIETPGGDLEHFALVLPPESRLPDRILGYPASVSALRGGQLWSVAVPALLAVVALDQVLPAIGERGCAAVVALGPVAAREFSSRMESLEKAPAYALPRPACVVADGAEDVVRGSPERVELTLAARGPTAARPELLTALAAWLQLRLASPFPGLRAQAELHDGCLHLLVVAPAADEPGSTLHRLRDTLRDLVLAPPTAEEAGEVAAVLQRRAVRWAANGGAVAAETAERLAFALPAGAELTPPFVTGAVLEEAARSVLVGHAGAARVVEREARAASPSGQTLDNGVTVSWRWIPGEVAAIAVALGGMAPDAGTAAGQAVATAAASAGWAATVVDVLGTQVVAAALPGADVAAFMERAAGSLLAFKPRPSDGLIDAAAGALGLVPSPRAESTVVAMDLPVTVDDAPEIVAKFFTDLPAGEVSAATPPSGAMLTWSEAAGPARLVAIVELPSNTAGVVAGEVLSARLRTAGLTARWLAAPGRPALLLAAEAPTDVPALDTALAASWAKARSKVDEEELRGAERSLVGRLYGDLLRAVARQAGGQFLPALPSPEALLATEGAEVNAALADLPSWANLRRLARGPAPSPPPVPASRGMRESPLRHPQPR
jgi:hypothetical protein